MKALLRLPFGILSIFLFLNFSTLGQSSTVVIGEVLYDTPLTETTSKHNGEFLSLYNYGNEDGYENGDESVDISGWRVEVTSLMSAGQITYNYTVPANTILPAYSLAIIAFRAPNDTFNVVEFYGSVDTGSNIVLYNNTLTLPNTRSQIRIYDANNVLQDEMIYDGTTAKLPDEQLLRAENGFNPDSLGSQSVSIQRNNISVYDDHHVFNRTDYYPHAPKQPVRMFSFFPPDYYFLADTSLPNPPSYIPIKPYLSLSGTKTGYNHQKALNRIQSTEIINSGFTTYTAGNEIVLNPGFEVKLGSQFEATVDADIDKQITIMTYNLEHGGGDKSYDRQFAIINSCNPDLVALQELGDNIKFKEVKKEIGLEGERCYGNALLWRSDLNKIKLRERITLFPVNDVRAYTVAEFSDFCFVAIHFSHVNENRRETMANKILDDNIIKDCKSSGKPIYIAGDMNTQPHQDGDGTAMKVFKDDGFQVLNNLARTDHKQTDDPTKGYGYVDSTRVSGAMIDLILEYNTNPNHKTVERGIPAKADRTFKLSDHLPYFVRVRYK